MAEITLTDIVIEGYLRVKILRGYLGCIEDQYR